MAQLALRLLLLLCAAAGPALGWDRPGCSRVPEVVQCYNKGWDGYDVQWQCRADLENAYRFGQMEVSCEGYDYPDDPYILRGSCSLLFSLELTGEGERKVKNSGSFASSYYQSRKDYSDSGSGAIVVIVLLVLAFGVYKLFLSNQQSQQSSGHSDGFSQPFWRSQQAPPPPGFKSTFTDDNSFGTHSHHGTSSGPGFWTGLGAGGLLGYLAGSHSTAKFPVSQYVDRSHSYTSYAWALKEFHRRKQFRNKNCLWLWGHKAKMKSLTLVLLQ
ncbi:hypothetical protein IHE44_0013185 [Lamprotornis superbus]|uniref:Store-operated calcium entry-associated regulatory factor n=1 Tax=Lamprotornis superbus TaxID=245042 RepID=A0A835NDZ6_9PASS|nr:hypothetical protein IHE44_0013185 [Lamprotornis superbus]